MSSIDQNPRNSKYLDSAEALLSKELFRDPNQDEYWAVLEKIKELQSKLFSGHNCRGEWNFLKEVESSISSPMNLYSFHMFLGRRMLACSQYLKQIEDKLSALESAKTHFAQANLIQPNVNTAEQCIAIEKKITALRLETQHNQIVEESIKCFQKRLIDYDSCSKMRLTFILNPDRQI
ncbi:inclusion protein [Simkania negevensis Z]|uniref:Inclusion protein n=2 Tax=Simkania negevensis TaxID=83561 RepID=F8L713_SIMNZ|nr:inclusion protein [Simkania negevensis Z]